MVLSVCCVQLALQIERLVRRRGNELVRVGPGVWDRAPVDEAIELIRRLDARSDVVLRALIETGDELSVCVVIEALQPIMKRRCHNDRNVLSDLIAEVAIAVRERRGDSRWPANRRIANCVVDRAYYRARRLRLPDKRVAPIDDMVVFDRTATDTPDPERTAVDRRAIADFRDAIVAQAESRPQMGKVWGSLVELVGCDERGVRTAQQRYRMAYVRRVLRAHAHPDLVA